MIEVMVSELKAKLSSYLARVRKGETVVVCDRRTPLARIVPLDAADDELWIDEPQHPLPGVGDVRGVALLRPVDVVALLRADREQR